MKRKYNKMNKKGMALSQIIIILLGTIAFSYILGSSIGFVSALSNECAALGVTGSTFCYGGGTSTAPYRIYTVTSATTLSRADGHTYRLSGSTWTRNDGVVVSTQSGDNPTLFNQYATTAINNWKAAQTAGSTCPSGYPNLCTSTQYCGGTGAAEFQIFTGVCCSVPCLPRSENPPAPPECSATNPCTAAGKHCDIATGKCKEDTQAQTTTPAPAPDVASIALGGLSSWIVGKGTNALDTTLDAVFGKTATEGAGTAGADATKVPFLDKVWNKFLNPVGEFLNSGWGLVTVTGLAAVTQFLWTGLTTGDWGLASDAAVRTGLAAAAGWGAAELSVGGLNLLGLGISTGLAGWIATGAVVLFIWLSTFLRRGSNRTVIFSCSPWQTPTGGTNCDACNHGNFPCTEYQCASLGAACELINKDTDNQACQWINSGDLSAPDITPRVASLPDGGLYHYEPLPNTQGPGEFIKYGTQECLPAFQIFSFGVELNKRGYCKIDDNRTDDFSQMQHDMGGVGDYIINHTQIMTFPGVANMQQAGLEVPADGQFEFYVRCMSVNGKADKAEYLFKFCIDPGPDNTPPEIRGFNWVNNSPIAHFAEGESRQVNAQVYTNEPATCKWDHEDKSYESMAKTLTCNPSLFNYNAQLSYSCSGTLDGLENGQSNQFYFRCNDTFGNVDPSSTELTLRGTKTLAITAVGPADGIVIKGATNSVKVTLTATTAEGSDNGASTCSYSQTGSPNSFTNFPGVASYQHSVNIWLQAGSYPNYHIRCVDAGGNGDEKTVSFSVETDTSPPIVVRASHESSNLNIKTNEEATCVYDIVDCNYPFTRGIAMTTSDKLTHTTPWVAGRTYYIKCKDSFNTEPNANTCTAILSSSQI